MSIMIDCPKCGTGHNLSDNVSGEVVACRKCAGLFAVEGAGIPPPPPKLAAPPPLARAVEDGEDENEPVDEVDEVEAQPQRQEEHSLVLLWFWLLGLLTLQGGMLVACGGGLAFWYFSFSTTTNTSWAGPSPTPSPTTTFNPGIPVPPSRNPNVTPGITTPVRPPEPVINTTAEALDAIRSGDRTRQRFGAAYFTRNRPDGRRAEVAEELMRLAKGTDTGLAPNACLALATWGGADQVPELITLLRSPWLEIRHQAIDTLAALKDDRAVAALAERLSDGNDKAKATEALAKLGKTPADAELTRELALLKSTATFIAKDAADRLARQNPTGNPRRRDVFTALLAALKSNSDGFTTQPLGNALGVWATADDVPTIVSLVESGSGEPRRGAVQALAKSKDARGAKVVAELLKRVEDRSMAQAALVEMGAIAEPALWPLLSGADDGAIQTVLHVLRTIGTAKSVEPVQKLIDEASGDPKRLGVLAQARFTLRQIRTRP